MAVETFQINWQSENTANFPNQNLQVTAGGNLIGTPQFQTVRQTIVAVDGANVINLDLGQNITLDLRSTTTNVNLTLSNPTESTYNITVVDNATTARQVTINTLTLFSVEIPTETFTVAGSAITAVNNGTRYMIQLAYHSNDVALALHFVGTAFRIS